MMQIDGSLLGKTEIGVLVKIDIDDILFIQTKEFSPLKTVGLIGLVGLLSAGVYNFFSALTFDLDFRIE